MGREVLLGDCLGKNIDKKLYFHDLHKQFAEKFESKHIGVL